MRHALTLAFLAACLPSLGAGEKTSPIPLRYQGLNQTKFLELKEVLGHPEQPPPLGHTAILSKDDKLGLFVGGGGSDIDGKTDESFLSLWDVASSRLVREIRIPGKAITCLALDAEGKRALTGLYGSEGKDRESTELVLWDLQTGKALHRFSFPVSKKKINTEAYYAAAFSPDGKKVLASGSRGTIQALDLEAGTMATFRPSKEADRACLDIIYHSSERAFLTWGPDVLLWDLNRNAAVQTYKGAKEEILRLALSRDGKTLAGASLEPAVHVWHLEKASEIAVLSKGPRNIPLTSLAFTGTKNELLTVWTGNDAMTGMPAPASVVLWDPESKKEVWSQPAKLQGLIPLAVQEKEVIVGGGANLFLRFDLATGKQERVWGGHKSPVTALASLKALVVSGSQEGHLKFWKNGEGPRHVVGHDDAIFAIRAEGDQFLTASADKLVKLWDATGKVVQTYKGHTENVMGVVIAPGGKWMASAGGDRVIRTWEKDSGKPIAVLSGHSEGINALAISPDGKWLATASDDNSVRLWPVEDGKPVKDLDVGILEGHKRQVTTVAFTPDGKYLLSGSQDKTIRIWDVEKQRTHRILEGHQNWISSLLVWNDRAISTADDFRVIIWDLKKGKMDDMIDLTPYGDCPRSLALSADGNGFLVGTSGWVILRFELLKK